jgi:hypothetical protein
MVKWKLLIRKTTMKGNSGNWEIILDDNEEIEFKSY